MILNYFYHRPPLYEGNEAFYNSIWGYLYVAIYVIGFFFVIYLVIDLEFDINEKIARKIKNYKEKRAKIKEHNREQIERQKKWRILN